MVVLDIVWLSEIVFCEFLNISSICVLLGKLKCVCVLVCSIVWFSVVIDVWIGILIILVCCSLEFGIVESIWFVVWVLIWLVSFVLVLVLWIIIGIWCWCWGGKGRL